MHVFKNDGTGGFVNLYSINFYITSSLTAILCWVTEVPTSPFKISEPLNPSYDVLELHIIRRSADFEDQKL